MPCKDVGDEIGFFRAAFGRRGRFFGRRGAGVRLPRGGLCFFFGGLLRAAEGVKRL